MKWEGWSKLKLNTVSFGSMVFLIEDQISK